jgi:hypothetical protein
MVGWFDPGQLVRTGVDVVISAIFARNSDRRVLDALSHPTADPADYSSEPELWLDYVADTGDGWNSTYAVANSLAQPMLDVDVDGARRTTQRGDVLVFGGDAVYPVASREAYEHRLTAAYRTALPEAPPSRRRSSPSRGITTGTTASSPSRGSSAPEASGASPAGGPTRSAATSP